jgi:hypothetical protein
VPKLCLTRAHSSAFQRTPAHVAVGMEPPINPVRFSLLAGLVLGTMWALDLGLRTELATLGKWGKGGQTAGIIFGAIVVAGVLVMAGSRLGRVDEFRGWRVSRASVR